MEMMNGAVFYQKGIPLRFEKVSIPKVSSDEVLVKVSGCGICQSDLEYIDLGVPTFKKPPIILGHEAAGFICEVGDSVRGLKVGSPVLCASLFPVVFAVIAGRVGIMSVSIR